MTRQAGNQDGAGGPRSGEPAGPRRALYAAVWRWHFYAGVFVAPFLALLAVTGLVMLAREPIERWQLGAEVWRGGSVGRATHQARLEAGRAVLPQGGQVLYRPGRVPGDATRVTVGGDGDAATAFVDPATASVLGTARDSRLLPAIAEQIHGKLLLGDLGDGVIEVAASLGVLLLVSGLFLWIPRGTGVLDALRVRRHDRRVAWRDLHKAIGALLAPVLGFYLVSGLAWTNVWGGKFVQAWSTLGAARAPQRAAAKTHAAIEVGVHRVAPWNLEQAALPLSGEAGDAPLRPLDLDEVIAAAQREGIGERFSVALPVGEEDVFTISQTAMNADVTDPRQELVVHVDQHFGKVVGRAGWGDYDLVARAMASGIPLHMGLLGTWSLVGAAAACLAILLLSVSGLAAWWLRRPARVVRLLAPPRQPLARIPLPTWLCLAVLGLLFPLAGATLLAVAALDWAVVRRFPALARVLS